MLELQNRSREILREIIDRYVDTAEPVSSKSISASMSLSPATIRNEMAALEEAGLLEQPHTSAGRIPTASGYRLYVDGLMRRHRLSIEESEKLNRELARRVVELDRIIAYAGQVASRLTSLPAYALTRARVEITARRFDIIEVDPQSFILVVMLDNEVVKNKLFHTPQAVPDGFLQKVSMLLNSSFAGVTEAGITEALILSAERASVDKLGVFAVIARFLIEILSETAQSGHVVSGGARLLEHPEFRDAEKAQKLLSFIEDEVALMALPTPDGGASTKITIGSENLAAELRDSSVVVTRFGLGDDTELLLGVVGPTRMDYSRVVTKLQYLAQGLTGGLSPPGRLPDGISEPDD